MIPSLLLAVQILAAPQLQVIEIHPAAGDGRWRATYTFSAPVESVLFERQGRFRRTDWRAETRGYAVVHEKESERITLQAGARARRAVTISFPFETTHPEKDYQLFQPFTDGGVLLYTGHLEIANPEKKPASFLVAPRRGEHVIAGGRIHRKRFRWTNPDPDGTFLYFGRLAPVETPAMIAILDPGTPKWLIDRLRTAVPELFADYVKLTGATLDRKPALFLSFQPAADPNSTTWKGGTLTGVIQMHIEAVKDAPENPDLLERFFKFLAHEAAHLWNGQMFQNNERNQSWLHEGGADAFAWRALHRAGILDDRALTQKQVLDLNTCLALLGNESLHAAETGGNFRPVYHCGSALAWLTEAALRMRDPGADLHTIWRDLFQEAAKRSGKYDEALFLSILEDRTRDEELLRYFDDFLHGTMTNRVERTIAAFNAQGVKLAAAPELMPAGERRQWSMNLLGELMRQDCAGSFSYTRRGSGWVLHGSPGCATLKTDVVVETAEEHSLLREGAAAYDAATGRCQAGETVRLAGSASEIAIPCRPLPARPPWLTVP